MQSLGLCSAAYVNIAMYWVRSYSSIAARCPLFMPSSLARRGLASVDIMSSPILVGKKRSESGDGRIMRQASFVRGRRTEVGRLDRYVRVHHAEEALRVAMRPENR
eukprot:scaffold26682_cov206-Skeletonema_menzelii.AAC.2